MTRNSHKTALQDSLAEIEKLKREGVEDIHTLLMGGIVMYAARILEEVEPTYDILQKRAMNAFRLLAVSMLLNLILSAIITVAAVLYIAERMYP